MNLAMSALVLRKNIVVLVRQVITTKIPVMATTVSQNQNAKLLHGSSQIIIASKNALLIHLEIQTPIRAGQIASL